MIKVGITGGIASGKSTCAMHLMMKHYEIYSADSICHDLLKNEAKLAVIEEFGSYLVNHNDEIDRRVLGQMVFNNEEAREKLNAIMHPLVRSKIEEIIKNFKGNIIFFEIPLLFESGMEDLFDKTINIYTDRDIQIERICARDNTTLEEAIQRIDAQMTTEERNKRADFSIYSKDKDEMFKELDDIVRRIENNEI